MTEDPARDPSLTSWVEVPEDSDFPIQNLPYGVFDRPGEEARVGVAIGEHVLDLAAVHDARLLHGVDRLLPDVFTHPASLNGLLACGRATWRALRGRLAELLTDERHRPDVEPHLLPRDEARMRLPVSVRDYVDFYSSLEHATNMGRMFRPEQEPLLPNWRWLPVGYHGRARTVLGSGIGIRRPRGIVRRGDADPSYEPTAQLDVELEMGFVTGEANELGRPIPIERAHDLVFGLVLVNDWSARDIQAFEYQPLGPFLGKSFATSISPWVVTLDALEPFRVPGPRQDPPPLPHLRTEEPWAFDIELEMGLRTASMSEPATISRTNFRYVYWSIAQQLAHVTSNGATVGPGDLFASGTISGPSPASYGSLIELSWRGTRPIELPDGSTRTFLEVGDEVVIRGWCERDGHPRIGFGDVRGEIEPAPSS